MTRERNRTAVHEIGPNMTPLVDVVMVILIFLMLAGTFAGGHWFLRAKPVVGAAGTGKPDLRTVSLDVYIDQSTGGFVARFGDQSISGDRDILRHKLDARRAQLEAIGTAPDDVQVTLRPTRGVKYDQLMHVYEAALRAKFTRVGFACSTANVE